MKYYVYIFIIAFKTLIARSYEPIRLTDHDISATVRGHQLEIFEDKQGTYTVKEIMALPVDSFYVLVNQVPTNKNTKSTYWLRFGLQNHAAAHRKWLIELFDHHINEVTLYTAGVNTDHTYGNMIQFGKRRFMHKNITFDLNIPSGEAQTYILRIRSDNNNVIMPEIRSYELFTAYALGEYYLLGIFYGILLIMAIYNCLLYLAIKRITYLYYVFYVFAVALHTMSQNGLGFQFIWPTQPWINRWSVDIGIYATMLFSVLFTKTFLHVSKHYPKMDKIINIALIVRSILLFLGIVFYPPLAKYKFLDLIPFAITCIVAVISFVKENRVSRYFIVAYILVYITFIITILEQYGLVGSNILTVYSLNIGIVLDIILLSISLADQLRREIRGKERMAALLLEEMKEKDQISQKVNRELEEKVLQRTIELNEANIKLKHQVEDTIKMNLTLDTLNWNLKKDVTEISQKRIIQPTVDFEEFSKVYTDELACFRYIAALKASKKSKCKKCGASTFGKGKGIFDIRCTKCGYNESITANTLFHKLKFPIEKAFYMTHLVFTRPDITADELVELVAIRRETCYYFKKKIMDRINSMDKKRLDRWDVLILNDEA